MARSKKHNKTIQGKQGKGDSKKTGPNKKAWLIALIILCIITGLGLLTVFVLVKVAPFDAAVHVKRAGIVISLAGGAGLFYVIFKLYLKAFKQIVAILCGIGTLAVFVVAVNLYMTGIMRWSIFGGSVTAKWDYVELLGEIEEQHAVLQEAMAHLEGSYKQALGNVRWDDEEVQIMLARLREARRKLEESEKTLNSLEEKIRQLAEEEIAREETRKREKKPGSPSQSGDLQDVNDANLVAAG